MLSEQVQTPQNTPNVIQPWRHPFQTLRHHFSPLVSKSSRILFANKRKPKIAKVNSRKYLNLTYSTIQKLKRSRTASWLFRFELCISQVFQGRLPTSETCLEKLPSVLQLSSLRRPVRFLAERRCKMPPNSQWGGSDLTEREILLEHTDDRLCRVWALDKTQKHC